MRSRPAVDVRFSPPIVGPGDRLVVETILTSRSETPIDYVSVTLEGSIRGIGFNNEAAGAFRNVVFAKQWRAPKGKLTKGKHPYKVAFDLPSDLPPSYAGVIGSVSHVLTVHVAIPWWADRIETFGVPLLFPFSETNVVRPGNFATSPNGPRGTVTYMEAALDTTVLTPGEVLVGSISIANIRGRRVRGIDLAFIETERIEIPGYAPIESRRFKLRAYEGSPPEGAPTPFRVRVPEAATPTFRAGALAVKTHLEIRADVAWSEDVVLRIPVHMAPRAKALVAKVGWVAPVGRERRALVWNDVATRTGLVSDPDAERMTGVRGIVGLAIRTEQRDADFWFVAHLAFPPFGLDLTIGERKWSDVLAVDVAKVGDAALDERFAIHAREAAQARAAITADALRPLLAFDSVEIHDRTAVLGARGTVHTTEGTTAFVDRVLTAADAIAMAHARVPPPVLFAPHAPAWQAFAERVRGRLEPGRMWIHDGQIGIDRFEIGSEWARGGALLGTTARVVIDPPLAKPPLSPDDPEVSPAARASWKELTTRVKSVQVEADAIVLEIEGKIEDPQKIEPHVELAIALRRALAGVLAQGPFR